MSAETADTRLVLVRHGESEAQVQAFIGGHEGCRGLSDLGRRQVELLRKRLERTNELAGTHALYASLLPRAIETAEILSPALGSLKVATDCDLCEGHPGEADGLTWDEWRERYADQVVGRGPYVPWAPGGESWADVVVRTGRTLTRIAEEHANQTVVVACHGGIIEASLRAFAHVPLEPQWRGQIDNASITEWVLREYEDPNPGHRWTLVRFNDAAHLQEL